ncbi:hypothetical protein NG895_26555 [Aeoliella sp. ICT_H6.2]|uniref:PEP-CTERM protein-sorting domain-containing protein n=1 Tax=Aeoliella straminimaris TaxID=2954799 RepID=A0A9X2FEB6_9BACT|nr:hypothetical protein [Aeoliella straminimaris]MCO6047480.1 hypothetical protein [Aeoliella straminimaris]
MLKQLLIVAAVFVCPVGLHAQILPPVGPFYGFESVSGFDEGWEFVGGWMTMEVQPGRLTPDMITGWELQFMSPSSETPHRLTGGDFSGNSSVSIPQPNYVYQETLTVSLDGVTQGISATLEMPQYLEFSSNDGTLGATWYGGRTSTAHPVPYLQLYDSSVTSMPNYSEAHLEVGANNVARFVAAEEVPEPSTLLGGILALAVACCGRRLLL